MTAQKERFVTYIRDRMQREEVTVVLTSCRRFDLLEKTLISFFKYNSYPIKEFIITEDSANIDALREVTSRFDQVNFTLLYNDPNIGQLPSIDRAYSHVKTDYIFHCEEDWEFYQEGFIERSMKILKENKNIITVWLREHSDTNKHPIEPEVFKTEDGTISFQLMETNFKGLFHGFTFNPGLRRLADYELLKPFSRFDDEEDICVEYHKYNFRGAIMPKGSVKHIGNHRKIRYKNTEKEWVKAFSHKWNKVRAEVCKLFARK